MNASYWLRIMVEAVSIDKLKIGVISRGWWYIVFGGAERFIHEVSKELHSLGYEVIGLTQLINGKEIPNISYKLLFFTETKMLPIVSSVKFSLWAARVTNKIKPDIVLVNSYWGELSPIFIDKDIPIIAIIHDVGLFRSKTYRFDYILRVYILRKIIDRSRYVVVPTFAVKKDIVHFLRANPSKIAVLGFEGVAGPFKKVHDDNEFFDIVQVGRFAPNKGHLIMLRAFKEVIKEIPNARLWLVGGKSLKPQHRKYFALVKQLVDEINRKIGKVVVRIIVDASSVDPYYQLADICVAPSIGEEGFGLTIIECMAYGKPVIASDIFVETGVASPERCLIFRRGDYKELYRLIIKLNKDKALYQKLSVEGLKYSKKNSWKNVTVSLVKLIEAASKR